MNSISINHLPLFILSFYWKSEFNRCFTFFSRLY